MAISDRLSLARTRPGLSLEDWAAEMDDSGVDALQLREKDLADGALFELALEVRRRFHGLLLVNGRIDIALAAGAEGVHLPESGLPVECLRRRFGSRVLLGRSVHDLSGVREARRTGADFVTLSPIYHSPEKGAALGPLVLESAAREGIPVLALGGVELRALPELHRCGAAGVAAIRLFQRPQITRDAVAAAQQLWSG